ncbi:MAG: hypothetical protein E6L08_11785 [Verrucomicrobia bacterium]|nr:MAG: hypothetical protein E6L08_11785 [Verrucomicrobiota bacterium]
MPKDVKQLLLNELRERFGSIKKLPNSQSLFEIGNQARIYVRYSKLHPNNRTFYGLRQTDLQQLEGHQSLICFLWDSQKEPLLIPYRDFEEVFATLIPASDGQFKAQVYPQEEGTELYIANAGRFNVESYFGWNETNSISPASAERWNKELTHSQVQTLLGSIGARKGHNIWLPRNDRNKMDWNLARRFEFFEIEHSTPIYSGLLRFNDVRVLMPTLQTRFTVVANDSRRLRFTSQVNRPTFRASQLSELCSFLDYANVFEWHKRLFGKG